MKRRNFLSGLLAAPLALKARLARFFGRPDLSGSAGIPRNDPKPVELCNAPIGKSVARVQPEAAQRQALLERAKCLLGPALSMQPDVRPACQALVERWVSVSTPFRSQRTYHHGELFLTGLDQPISNPPSFHCSLPRGHEGPHALLNPR